MADSRINLPYATTDQNRKINDPFACRTRDKIPSHPKNITETLFQYIPLDGQFSRTIISHNIFKMPIYKTKLEMGKVYQAYDGYRLMIEVGCNTVIYLNINPGSAEHHKFYLLSGDQFIHDITDRLLAKQVVQKTRLVVVIAKYEMYFLMGLFSTVSFAMWLAVTGSDVTYMFAVNRGKIGAFKKLSDTFDKEMDEIQKYAPVLHQKLSEFIANEKINNAKAAVKEIPGKVVKDEKAQAQVAGILFGKYTMSSKPFTVWTAFSTVLAQAAVKSGTKSIDAYASAVDKRYAGTIKELENLDWKNDVEVRKFSSKMVLMFDEANVPMSKDEMFKILKEVRSNPDKLEKNIRKIYDAFTDFQRKMQSTNSL